MIAPLEHLLKTEAHMKMKAKTFETKSENYDGYCSSCDAVTQKGGVEPDAQGYECPKCKKKTLMGIDEALMAGHLEIT